MPDLPRAIVTVIGVFASRVSTRVLAPVKWLLVGAILAPGKRTVTAVLPVLGKSTDVPCQH